MLPNQSIFVTNIFFYYIMGVFTRNYSDYSVKYIALVACYRFSRENLLLHEITDYLCIIEFLKQSYIHTHIIGLYNPSVRITT